MPFGVSRLKSNGHSSTQANPGVQSTGSKTIKSFGSPLNQLGNRSAEFMTSLNQIEDECRLKREWNKMKSEQQQQASEVGPNSDSVNVENNYRNKDPIPGKHYFEYFIVCGLPPDADVVASAVSSKQAKQARLNGADAILQNLRTPYRNPGGPVYPAKVLYSWSPKSSEIDCSDGSLRSSDCSSSDRESNDDILDLAAGLCFPNGVGPSLVEKRPSMSDVNELMYGLKFEKEDTSFTFTLKGTGGNNLYGVCICENEVMKLPPSLAAKGYASFTGLDRRYIVTAPRAYCILSYYPFFELHFDIISTVLKIERVERLRKLMAMPEPAMASNADHLLSTASTSFSDRILESSLLRHRSSDANNNDFNSASASETTGNSSPYSSQTSLQELDTSSVQRNTCNGSESSFSETVASGPSTPTWTRVKSLKSDESHNSIKSRSSLGKTTDKTISKSIGEKSDKGCETQKSFSTEERDYNCTDEKLSNKSVVSRDIKGVQDNDNASDNFHHKDSKVEREPSSKAQNHTDEDDEVEAILHEYYNSRVPLRGYSSTITFSSAPLELHFKRWMAPRDMSIPYRDDDYVSLAEASSSAGAWAVATLCRNLSLENTIIMLSCVLLEKQVVVFCPTLGTLTGVVWAMAPLILPFIWQSVVFPVMPSSMIGFLDAPVPFIAGIQHKTDHVREKSSDLLRVNVYKDKINKQAGNVPLLPRHQQLMTTISSHYEILAKSHTISNTNGPIFKITQQEHKHANAIIALVNRHLVGLCSDIMAHSITQIAHTPNQSKSINEKRNEKRVTVLLKESFVGSFSDDQEHEFMSLFVETQMFGTYSDAIFANAND